MGTKKKSFIKLLTAMCISIMVLGLATITGSASDFTSPKESYKFTDSGSKSFTANLTTSNLEEWYEFTLPSDGYVSLTLTTYVTGYCYLYTPDMETLTNPSGSGTSASPVTTSTSLALSKGTYYVRLSGRSAGKMIAKVTYKNYNTLSNKSSTQSGAPSVKVGTLYNGALTRTASQDWYKYTITEAGTYTLSVTYGGDFLGAWDYAYYYLKNSSLSKTYASGSNNGGTVFSETVTLPKGTYYLYFEQSRSGSARDEGQITFKLSKKSSSSSSSIKKGSTYTVGKLTYKVTSAKTNGNGTVTVTAPKSKSVTSVTIPATVTINGVSFKVTKIGASAFSGCTSLKSVSIGKNVQSIGKKAFYNCKKLKTITIKGKKLTSVGNNAFKGIKSTAKIKVPSSKLSSYKKLLKGKGQGSKVTITKN